MRKLEKFMPLPIPEEEQTDKISVIVAVYNIEAYLEKCVRSLRNQTYRNLQIILVDDGTTDRSFEKIASFLSNEKISVIHQENRGPSADTGRVTGTGRWMLPPVRP